MAFDGVGLPGFQFIQDTVEYNSVTQHYNMALDAIFMEGTASPMAAALRRPSRRATW